MRDDWVETTLGEVARTRPPAGVAAPGIPYVALEHFDSGSPALHRWGDSADATSATTPFEPGDVLFGKLRPYLRKVVVAEFSGRCTNEALAYRVSSPALSQEYLALLLRSDAALSHASVTTGTRMPRTSARSMATMRVLLPSLEEQRRIVDLMSHVDDALRSCDALVSAEGALLDAASEALVFSPEFPLMKVGDLAEGKRGLVGGPFGSSLVGRDYVETGVPVIRGQNLQGRYVSGDFVFVSEEKSRSLHGNQATPGDVVFTQRGTLGQVSLIPDDAYPNYVVSQSQMRLTPDRSIVSADWVYHAFRTPRMVQRIKRADTSTANPHINLGILRTMDVPIPSVDMQAQVCSQLNAIEASIVAKMAESEALKSTRGALLSALLGGTHQIPSSYDEFIRDEGAA